MKQVAQRPRDGRIQVVDVTLLSLRPGWLLIANRCSLISAGTERSKVELGVRSLAQKARARPDLVRKVIDRARTERVGPALAATRERLETLTPLGYSSAGTVLRVDSGVEGIAAGDRVACGGRAFATHAEVIAMPRNLVAAVPDGVAVSAKSDPGAHSWWSVPWGSAFVEVRTEIIVGRAGLEAALAINCRARMVRRRFNLVVLYV